MLNEGARALVWLAMTVLWLAGLRLFVRAELPQRRKLGWIAVLVAVGSIMGALLPGTEIWRKFVWVILLLPLLAAADVLLFRSRRSWSFWVRACGFEVGTIFAVAGGVRWLLDRAGGR